MADDDESNLPSVGDQQLDMLTSSVEVTAHALVTNGSKRLLHGFDPQYNRSFEIEILHLDENYIVIDKPFYVRIDGPTDKSPTIEHILKTAFPTVPVFHLIHQLDFVTSGVHVWGLNRHAARRACSQFAQRTVRKTYNAIVEGHIVLDEFEVDKHIADMVNDPHKRMCIGSIENPGRPAKTLFKTLIRTTFHSKPVSYLHITPITGRRHQIRVHLHSIGHPIVGDYLYQEPLMAESPRTMLHARSIFVPLPTGNLQIDSGDALLGYLNNSASEAEKLTKQL
ncbi:RNA pseudouridylate synthase domain-containing protein 1 [Dinochytrium kinnereticum]|nr:RNA pseudouridylate synthase domain-containing protein 1 [Dinochytrium kinnereticum]